MAGAAEWVTIILFIEITKRAFIRLKTQEVIILYWVAAGWVMVGVRLGWGDTLWGAIRGIDLGSVFCPVPPGKGNCYLYT